MLGIGLVYGMNNPATVWGGDQALFFDGVNDYAKFDTRGFNAASNILINTMHVSIWVLLKNEGSDTQTIFYIKDVDGTAYAKLCYATDTEQYIVTRTDTDGNNPVNLTHDFPLAGFPDGQVNIHVRITEGAMAISTSGAGISTTSTTSGGSGVWDSDTEVELYLGRDLSSGSDLFQGWMSNLAIWNEDSWGGASNADIFNSGEPKNELETANSGLFLYYTASEAATSSNGQTITYSQAYDNDVMVFYGPILTGHG